MISKTGIMALVCGMLAAVMPPPAGAADDAGSLEQDLDVRLVEVDGDHTPGDVEGDDQALGDGGGEDAR